MFLREKPFFRMLTIDNTQYFSTRNDRYGDFRKTSLTIYNIAKVPGGVFDDLSFSAQCNRTNNTFPQWNTEGPVKLVRLWTFSAMPGFLYQHSLFFIQEVYHTVFK